MEKLIELLNERIKEWWKPYWDDYSITKIDEIWKSDWLYFVSFVWEDYPWPVNLEHILTKQAGLIKWLVENDKIDTVKVYENLTNYEIEIRIRAVKELLENNEEDTIAYLKLLMLLAIQDNPIEFLCSVLK